MATFTVTTTDDRIDAGDGVLSLREAVARANATTAADTIVFSAAIEGSTLALTGGELRLTQDTTIDGDQNNDGAGITLSGNHASRIMTTTGQNTDTVIRDTTFINGNTLGETYGDREGGAIRSYGSSLTIENSTFSANQSHDRYDEYGDAGGAVYVSGGVLTVSSSVFVDNVGRVGGAIATGVGGAANVTIRDSTFSNNTAAAGGAMIINGSLQLEDSLIDGNLGYQYHSGGGGGINLFGTGVIMRCSILNNQTLYSGGGVDCNNGTLTIVDSTIAGNTAFNNFSSGQGGGVQSSGLLVLRNTTITGNVAEGGYYEPGMGGGVRAGSVDAANTIIAGNSALPADFDGAPGLGADLFGPVVVSNGHNIFGSDVVGAISGDRENIAAGTLFAALDAATGGGRVNADGVVALRANVANPAQGGADRVLFSSTDQLGTPRAAPSESNPDTGSVESAFAVSTVASANNDALTGTAAANAISGLAGHDFIKGLAGNDTLNGNDGGDFFTGGGGNDRINGGNGIDLVNYADLATAVTVDLRGDAAADTDTARRGTETDTLTGIEGAIGSSRNDTFLGDGGANWFQGGNGKDIFTGGAGRDLYDYNLTDASPVGANRDVITDFAHLTDDIDLMGIDANTTVAGNQAFRFVGTAALSGAGQVGYFTSGGNTIIRMSTDADAASEGEIQLTGIKTLTAVDFYL